MDSFLHFNCLPTWLYVSLAVFYGILYYRRRVIRMRANPRCLPHPPGPKPLPIIGNLFDIARENEVEAYQKLAQDHGALVFLSTLGKNLLFVNTFHHAYEIFERRSSNYSDRGTSIMCHELMGWDFSFGHMPYGDEWRKHRRMFHSQFQQAKISNHFPVIRREAHILLRCLLHSPNALEHHLRHNAAAVIMGVVYGIPINSRNDRYIGIAEKALDGMARAAAPGAFLVDILPFLKHIPTWLPGAGFHHKASEWRQAVEEMKETPFAAVQHAMRFGKAPLSFVSTLLNELDIKQDDPDDQLTTVKNCAGMAYAAGAESTVSALLSFVLGVVLNPEIQVKAQAELDEIVGRERLPELSDRPSLPYINAILKEVLRWNPVAPLALPHMATHDDEYNGYFIPAGTLVIGNSWGILHDPHIYPEPHLFKPERFLGQSSLLHLSSSDPLSVTFGYGRRACPGRYMAETQLWLSIACILSVFDIRPPLDAEGRRVEVVPSFSSGFISMPNSFNFSLAPRHDAARNLIEQTLR